MNSKIIVALLLASVMAISSGVIASSGGSDADDAPTANISINANDTQLGQDLLIRFSESEYSVDGAYKYTLKWDAASTDDSFTTGNATWKELGSRDNDGNYTQNLSGRQVFGDDDLKISLDLRELATNTPNEYYLNVRAAEGATITEETTMYIVLRASVTLQDASDSNVLTLAPFTYNVTVRVSPATSFEITGSYEFKQYSRVSSPISANLGGTEITVSDYTWYAKDMPKGLSMSPNGMIVGYPVEVGTDSSPKTTTVSVLARDVSGNAYTGTFDIIVNPYVAGSENPEIEFKVDSHEGSGPFYIESGKDFKFTVSFKVGEEPIDVPITVLAIRDDTNAQYVTSEDGTYTLDTNGSGRITVTAYATYGTTQYTGSIVVNVISSGDGVNPTIVVSSS